MTPESHCHAKRATGFDCQAPEPGSCRECEMAAEVVKHFGTDIRIDDVPLSEIHTPPSAACHVCKRQAIRGLVYEGQPLCASCAPYPTAGELMLAFSETEEEALEAGGAAGGEYLDEIGVGEMFDKVTPEQWREFLSRVLGGYSEFMRAEVKKYPPF